MVSRAAPTAEQVDKILNNMVVKVNVVAGAAADTNIAIAGIKTGDKLVSVLQVEPDNGATGTMLTDRTGEASITSDGNIQLTTTNTTGKQLLVIWLDITD